MRLSDVIKQRHMKQVNDEKRWAALDAERAKFTVQDNLHPAIGSLMTVAGVKYYAYVNGVYREGSAEDLSSLLK
jgi:predicted cobalt transporter CbtA